MFQRTIQLANEHMQEAMKLYQAADETYREWQTSAAEPEKRSMGLYIWAEKYEEQAEKHALLAAEYYVEAECHDWSKRG